MANSNSPRSRATHGGPRPGAGRKPGSTIETDDPKVTISLRLEQSLVDRARAIGQGNASRGIRAALASHQDQPTKP